jgi:hypothetical protein
MRYLSPGSLLGDALPQPLDKKAIQLARKKLFAELELSGSDSLDIHGAPFTKNDIIDYFEELQKENISAYHQAIAEDAVLLAFLQDGFIDEGTKFRNAPIYADAGFIGWLSPYFHAAFTSFCADCFELTDETSMKTILENRLLMTVGDKERSWWFISNILNKNIALFDHYHGRARKNSPAPMPIENITAFIGHGYIQVIKQLPDSRFAQLKDTYAFSMQHPSIATFNRDIANRSVAMTWMKDAQGLAVSEDIRSRITSKLVELNEIERSSVRKKRPWGSLIWIIIVAVRLIAALASSASDNKYTPARTFDVTPDTKLPSYRTPTRLDTAYVDSLFRSNKVRH